MANLRRQIEEVVGTVFAGYIRASEYDHCVQTAVDKIVALTERHIKQAVDKIKESAEAELRRAHWNSNGINWDD
jgi:hypothetical protein